MRQCRLPDDGGCGCPGKSAGMVRPRNHNDGTARKVGGGMTKAVMISAPTKNEKAVTSDA